MGVTHNCLDYSYALEKPLYLSEVTSWHGLIPFALFLMSNLKPAVMVELGTHRGDSYLAFCQAAKEENLSTQCRAVDTWEGDQHSGYYDGSIYQELHRYNERHYSNFSVLIRRKFDDALELFEDSSIDLLHIDGLHTYEAVKHDFNSWLSKMNTSGVVLLHDISERAGDFGVWKFWEELKIKYSTFEIPNFHGLGMVAVGTRIPEILEPLFTNSHKASQAVEFFCTLGTQLVEEETRRVHFKVYMSNDDDFSETNTITYPLPRDNSDHFSVEVELPHSIQGLRIDPADVPTEISNLSVEGLIDRKFDFHSLNVETAVWHGFLKKNENTVTSLNDGQILLAPESIKNLIRLRIAFDYRILSREDLDQVMNQMMVDYERLESNIAIVNDQLQIAHDIQNQFESKYMDILRKAEVLGASLLDEENERMNLSKELSVAKQEIESFNVVNNAANAVINRQQDELSGLREMNRLVTQEIMAMKATKGWRLLDAIRTARTYLKQPISTARQLFTSVRLHGAKVTLQRISKKIHPINTTIDYNLWQHEQEIAFLSKSATLLRVIDGWAQRPLISVIMPTYNSKLVWLRDAVASLQKQLYKRWELIISDDCSTNEETLSLLRELANLDERIHVLFNNKNKGIAENTNIALDRATGDLVTFLDHDDLLSPCALYEVARIYVEKNFDILYSDEDKLGEFGKYEEPFFKPDYSPDYLLSCNYFNHLTVYHKDIITKTGLLRTEYDGAQDYDLLLRATECSSKVVHVPKILYHWRKVPGSTAASFDSKAYAHLAGKNAIEAALNRRGEEGHVQDTGYPGHYRVERKLTGLPLASIIIPIRDKIELLKNLMESLAKSTYKNVEIIVVDNGSQEQETLDYLSRQKNIKVMELNIPFNYSRLNNLAAKEAAGDFLIFLNNDIEVITPTWIEQMLQHAMRPSVGVVGAKLFYPNDTIQHAGVVLGIGGVAGHSHKYFPRRLMGYFSSLVDIKNYSAVSAACMMVPKRVFEEVGGFEEDNLPVAFNDVDLCLRIREREYLCVWTPWAELYHHESISRGYHVDPKEVLYMQKRWGPIIRNDPYYNPHLSLEREDYSLDLTRIEVDSTIDSVYTTLNSLSRKFMKDAHIADTFTEEAMEALIGVYLVRTDLQKAFNISDMESFRHLLRWAVNEGSGRDSAQHILSPYKKAYMDTLKAVMSKA